jgi:hypothetical protein
MIEVSSPKGLHRLVYASRFSDDFPTEMADQDHEIIGIISASITKNRQRSITGLLLLHKQQFLQVLEGPAENVMATYNAILQDKRHNSPRLISAGPADRRLFSDWNMCACRLSAADFAILETLDLKASADPSKISANGALSLLSAIARIQRRTMTVELA